MLLSVSRRDSFKAVDQHWEFARVYAAGATLKQALVQAGYSPKQAKKGMAIIRRSKGLRDALVSQGKLLVDLGRSCTPQEQEALVRGRLVWNVVQGCDKGVASARALGSDKRVAMWQPQTQHGIIVVVPPRGIPTDMLDSEE